MRFVSISFRRACALAGLALIATSAGAADVKLQRDGLLLIPSALESAHHLRVSGPAGLVFEDTFLGEEALLLSAAKFDGSWQNGTYTYEIWPVRGVAVRDGDRFDPDPHEAQIAPDVGVFSVLDGRFYLPSESPIEPTGPSKPVRRQDAQTKDQVIPDDLIVQGSLCVGLDCVNNEDFGFDTLRLKENSLRIKFEDTSTGSFPSVDWQLTANDSESGGADRFSIEDVTNARVPFTVRAGASTNSLFIDSTGRVGFRTATPVLDLHIATSNTPGLRFEQNSAGGFTAQTWDVAGNEANFFIRDVTSGSRLPFRIRPGAPTSSIDVAASGNVGFGTGSPLQRGHFRRSEAVEGLVLLENNSASVGDRVLLELRNNGGARFDMLNSGSSSRWRIGTANVNNEFQISLVGSGATELRLSPTGNLTITGTLSQGSDAASKENFGDVDPFAILGKIISLPISTWNYRTDGASVRHIGPMSQDFFRLFGFGASDKVISTVDTSGIAFAAIQALNSMIESKDAEIAALRDRTEQLEARLSRLERHSPGSAQVVAGTPERP